MDIMDCMKILEDSKAKLDQIINECNNGPEELALLASKMAPILDEFAAMQEELIASASISPPLTGSTDEIDASTEETSE